MISLIVWRSAVLAHFLLKERLHKLGILGCVMCIAGSIIIVIHAPQERPITSVQEIWSMATQSGWEFSLILVILLHIRISQPIINYQLYLYFCFSLSALRGISNCVGIYSGIPFLTTVWAHKCTCVHRHMFLDGVALGKFFECVVFCSIINKFVGFNTSFNKFLYYLEIRILFPYRQEITKWSQNCALCKLPLFIFILLKKCLIFIL